MSDMFNDAELFNQDIENWDTSSVIDMSGMFTDAAAFINQDLSSWDVSKITDHHSFSESWGTGNTEPIWND